MSSIPPLFARIPHNLLVPLASPLKETYWDVLIVAHRLHQAADLYEVIKETLLDRVEEHLLQREINPAHSAEDFDAELAEGEPANLSEPRLFAWRVLRQLERCGWFEYEYRRDFGPVLRFPDYALNLLATLEVIAQNERPHVQGLAYNVQQILTDEAKQHSDPGFVLYQAKNAVAALLRELKVLRANMGRYVERVAEREQVRDLLALQMNDFWPKVVEPSYQQFKTSDNVLRFRMEILDRLEELGNDPLFVQEAAARVEIQEQLEVEHAKARVHEWLDGMSAEIRSLDELIEEIDARHAHYVGLTLQRIRHRLHQNESTESRLVEMIQTLHELPTGEEELWDDLFAVHRLQMIEEESLYRVPGTAEPHIAEPLIANHFSEEDRSSLLAQVRESLSSPVSKDLVFSEMQKLLELQGTVELADLPLDNDLEFMRLIALHSYRHEATAPYEMLFDQNAPLVRTGNYVFRNGKLKPRPVTTQSD